MTQMEDPDRLAGLLNWQSDLTIREIVGLLDVDEVSAVGTEIAGSEEWVFSYDESDLRVERTILD
jgi:hypothetical protein